MDHIVLDLLKKQAEKLEIIEEKLTLSKLVLNVDEVSLLTNLSKSHIYKLTMSRGIPHYKQAKHLYFDKKEIEAWLKENPAITKKEIDQQAANFVCIKKGRE